MTNVEKFDGVLVVGAGPVGLFAALRLANAGLDVLVLDGRAGVLDSPRAAGFHWPLAKYFDDAGILEAILARGAVVKRANQFRRAATNQIDSMTFAVLDTEDERPFDLHCGQDQVCHVILDKLATMDNFEIRWGCGVEAVEQSGGDVTITATAQGGDTRRIRAPWVLGCDGSRSVVREQMGLNFEGHTWPRRFVATNVHFDFGAYGYAPATFVRDPVDWSLVIRLNTDNLHRVLFEEDASLDPETVRDRVADKYRQILPGPDPYELVRAASFIVQERTADRFREGRVLLAGDAAHVCNPTGGFGLMAGLLDIHAYIPALLAVIGGRADEAVLDDVAVERKRVFDEIVTPRATDYKRMISETDPERMREDDEGVRHACGNFEIMRKAVNFPSQLIGNTPPSVAALARTG